MPDAVVSVVIPTRNRRAMLARAVRSVLGQRDVALELVVVDDGSSDDTRSFLAAIRDDRLSVVHQDRQGVSEARNSGLRRAEAEWVAFLDDDDFWAPDKLVLQLGAARESPALGWLGTGTAIVDNRLRVLSGVPHYDGNLLPELLLANVVGVPSTIMAKAELLREAGPFDPALHTLADWDMWVRLAMRAPFGGVQRPLTAYTVHSGSMSKALRGIRGEIDHVERKFRKRREELGVDWPRGHTWDSAAQLHLAAGRRRSGYYLAVGRTRLGGLAWPVRAVAAGTYPARYRNMSLEVRRSRLPPGWIEEAQAWVSDIRG